MISTDFAEITKSEPEKSLIVHIRAKAGRNNRGVITTRHQGGGVKRYLRVIDFKRDKLGVPGRVAAIEYDPYRTARIALVNYADGEKRYILAPQGLNVGDTVMAGENAEIRPGNSLPMQLIPTGTFIHNIELVKGKGGQLVRSAGTGRSSWVRTAISLSCACHPVKFAAFRPTVRRQSDSFLTRNTRISKSAKRAETAIGASGRPSAARRCRPGPSAWGRLRSQPHRLPRAQDALG